MPSIVTKRGEIYYRDYRKEVTNSPLVLIHGAGGIHLDWSIQLRRDMGAIALDLPAHGKSPRPARQSIWDYAADVAAFLESMALENVILVGHSMGGAIAQAIALTHGNLLNALVLVGTAPHFNVNPAIIEGIVTSPEDTAKLIVKWEWAKTVSDNIKEQSLKRLLETPADVIQGDYIACNAFDVRERLHEIDLPALVLIGEADKMIPPDESQVLAEKIPNAKAFRFEGGGHMFHLEQADAVAKVVAEWLEIL